MKEIAPGLFGIKIPLPDSPLKYLNSYVIKGRGRNLIIDTGFDRQECLDAMLENIKLLGIELTNTDIFVSHLHGDHLGLVNRLAKGENRIYFNRFESELVKGFEGRFKELVSYFIMHGFPEDEIQLAVQKFPSRRSMPYLGQELEMIMEGDVIAVGTYRFTALETPGHSPGHTCLYEPEKKILLAGDHLLIDITSTIQCFSDDENPLNTYLKSLEKVRQLDVDLVLPGHGQSFRDHRKRIAELRKHHRLRLAEVLTILEQGEMNAYQVAARMAWNIRTDSWDQAPEEQKWFATGEAIAHLRYLEEEGKVGRRVADGVVSFSSLKG